MMISSLDADGVLGLKLVFKRVKNRISLDDIDETLSFPNAATVIEVTRNRTSSQMHHSHQSSPTRKWLERYC